MAHENAHTEGRLRARPAGTNGTAPVGLRLVGPGPADDGYLYVPADYREKPAPLVVLLHGAGEDARDGLALLRGQADEAGLILLALSSVGPTWDFLVGGYEPDVAAIDRALEWAFSLYRVDPDLVGVGGYSDGGSYALSLGLANGDMFTHVMAFSPGFLAPTGQAGSPRVFVSHGTRDGWLPIDHCSRRIVPRLERTGYEVRYREFDGPHVVPPEIGREAAAWFTAKQA
jgi:predicted esterase